MEPGFKKSFDKCPNCGSPDRFCEQLAQEMKDRGLARQEWSLFLTKGTGPVIDRNRAILMPVGVKIPAYIYATDVCMDCGTQYAIFLERGETQITAQEEPPPDPGLFREIRGKP